MVPAHRHWQVAFWSKTGSPEEVTGSGGSHGSAVAGTHGAGVNTPDAAEVAAMTAGFEGELHIPNDAMFVSGTKSLIVARRTAGAGAVATCGGPGITVSAAGVVPISHIICAPSATRIAIRIIFPDPLIAFNRCPGAIRPMLNSDIPVTGERVGAIRKARAR